MRSETMGRKRNKGPFKIVGETVITNYMFTFTHLLQ